MNQDQNQQVVVVGAGAGGMMAAGRAAEAGSRVLVLEKMARPGEKLSITGKMRCNLTNSKPLRDFIAMYGENGPFLYQAFHRFFRDDLIDFLASYGVEIKTERGGRIFPVSDRAMDIVEVMVRHMRNNGVVLKTRIKVNAIRVNNNHVLGIETDAGFIPAKAVILATGGATWPKTGSSGDGYRMAEILGHTIIKVRPALVPLIVKEIQLVKAMQDTVLRNVRLTAFACGKQGINPQLVPDQDVGRGIPGKKPKKPIIESRFGELTFTHFGLAGPITLLISLAVVDALEKGPVSVSIDLKPALSYEQLDQRIRKDLDREGKKHWVRIMGGLLPAGMILPLTMLAGIDPQKSAHQITMTERNIVVSLLKSLCFQIESPLPLSTAIVTAGGVSLREIDSRTMASQLVSGLFFCGEVMDIDADTGGYNLQAAFSTGFLAGQAAASYVLNG